MSPGGLEQGPESMGQTDDLSGRWLPSVLFAEVPPRWTPVALKGPLATLSPGPQHHPSLSIFFLFQAEQGGEFCQRKTEVLNVADGIQENAA